MNFIKRNLGMLLIFFITFCAAAFLIFKNMQLSAKLSSQLVLRNNIVEQIETAYRQTKPNVHKKNVEHIRKDLVVLEAKNFALKRIFGQFYRNAFKKFALNIEATKKDIKDENQETSAEEKKTFTTATAEQDLLNAFKAFYQKYPQEKKPRLIDVDNDRSTLDDFFMQYYINPQGSANQAQAEDGENKTPKLSKDALYRKGKLEKAIQEFKRDIEDIVPGEVDDSNVYNYLLAAFGVPRTAKVSYFKRMYNQAIGIALKNRLIPGIEKDEDIYKFVFPDKEEFVQEKVPNYLVQLQIRKDLFTRIKKAKIEKLDTLRGLTPYEGEKSGNFAKHIYTLTLIGNLESIRNFINDTQENAVKDNIVYIINDLSIKRFDKEDIARLMTEKSNNQNQNQNQNQQNQDANNNEEKELVILPVIGVSKNVIATMQITFVEYLGDQLERNN